MVTPVKVHHIPGARTDEPAKGDQPGGPVPAVSNTALANLPAAGKAQAFPTLAALGNLALGRLLGGGEPRADPFADPRFNPEFIVNQLARAIDSHDYQLVPAQVDLRKGEFKEASIVRHVNADAVIAAVDNLTPSQAAYVVALYETTEGRPLDVDLFGGGGSKLPSDLTNETSVRIHALLRGTRPEQPGPEVLDARLEADAVEIRHLLAKDLKEAGRERIMALHRRAPADITRLDRAYARISGDRSLSLDFVAKLSGLQQGRMLALRDGDWAKADAYAIEDKRLAIAAIDAKLAELGDDPKAVANLLRSTSVGADVMKKRDQLVADIQGIIAANVAEVSAKPTAVPGAYTPTEAASRRISAILATLTSTGTRSLADELQATLGEGAGGAIVATARGDWIAAAARQLLELEATRTTNADKVAALIRELRKRAFADVGASIFDPRVPADDKERIQNDAEGTADQIARSYLTSFVRTYDQIRGSARPWQKIVESASSGNKEMLTGLVAGGGELTDLQELEFALSRNNKEGVIAILANQADKAAVAALEAAYDKVPGRVGLQRRLFGPRGPEFASRVDSVPLTMAHEGWLLCGRDASRAAEAFAKPKTMGGAAEVDWLAQWGTEEVEATEATSGITGEVREWWDDPETQDLMNRSAQQLRQLPAAWRQDPWAVNRPELLAKARRLRATITGDTAAYEEENEAIRAKIREGVSFAVTVALGLALPGLGYGFAATMALNIGGTVVTNALVFGEKYGWAQFRNDVLGGIAGGLGSRFGEEVVKAIAANVALRSAPAAAAAIERAGASTVLRQEAKAAFLTGREISALEHVASWGAGAVGGAGGTTLVSGQNDFTASSLGLDFGLSFLGHLIWGRGHGGGPRPAAGPPGVPPEPSHAAPGQPGSEPGTTTVPAEPGPTPAPVEPSRPVANEPPRSTTDEPTRPTTEEPAPAGAPPAGFEATGLDARQVTRLLDAGVTPEQVHAVAGWLGEGAGAFLNRKNLSKADLEVVGRVAERLAPLVGDPVMDAGLARLTHESAEQQLNPATVAKRLDGVPAGKLAVVLRIYSDPLFPIRGTSKRQRDLLHEPNIIDLIDRYGSTLWQEMSRTEGKEVREQALRKLADRVAANPAEGDALVQSVLEARTPRAMADAVEVPRPTRRPPTKRATAEIRADVDDPLWGKFETQGRAFADEPGHAEWLATAMLPPQGETVGLTRAEVEHLLATLLQVESSARRGLYEGLQHEQKVALLGNFIELAGQLGWKGKWTIWANRASGAVSEALFLPEGALRQINLPHPPPSREITRVDYELPQKDRVISDRRNMVEQKSDKLSMPGIQGISAGDVAKAREYVRQGNLDRPGIEQIGAAHVIEFIRSPGNDVTRAAMLDVLLAHDSPFEAARIGEGDWITKAEWQARAAGPASKH